VTRGDERQDIPGGGHQLLHDSVSPVNTFRLVFNFYLFIVIAETLDRHPATRPDLIIWIPVLICIELGIYLLKRFN
jgi:hypothetical protein